VCVKDDYIQPLGPRDENMKKKLKKPTKTQCKKPSRDKQKHFYTPVKPTLKKIHTSVHWQMKSKEKHTPVEPINHRSITLV